MKTLQIILLLLCLVFTIEYSQAQKYTLKGKVTDTESGDAVPLANVYLRANQQIGTTTDFDGFYTLKTDEIGDTLVISYIGYVKKYKIIDKSKLEQVINVQLAPVPSEDNELEEVEFIARENPSWAIIRNAIKNKKVNDKRKIERYEYESYTKVVLDVDNVSEKFKNRKLVNKVTEKIDSIGQVTDDEGKALIPLFLSETVSQVHFLKNPERRTERILKTKVNGIGFNDDSPVSQILGSSFQEYNFYKNSLIILDKNFTSPLSDGWKLYYEFYLMDSLYIGEHWCYKIEMYPKRKQDLAFEGVMWIDSKTYALKQIDVQINKSANLNFIEKIRIQQELTPTASGAWLPIKSRILVDVMELTKKSAGILAKFYSSNKHIEIGKERPIKFYQHPIIIEDGSRQFDDDYWTKARHDSLTSDEILTYQLIDTINTIPTIRRYVETLKILSSGYIKWGKIDLGNLAYAYAYNNVEGHRFRAGFRTNQDFSEKLMFKSYLAYGTDDQSFKYNAALTYMPYRKTWTRIGIKRKEEIEQLVINSDNPVPILFEASLRFFDMESKLPFWKRQTAIFAQTDLVKGVTPKISLRNYSFEPIGDYFQYYTNPNQADSPVRSTFTTTELMFETRLAKQERFFYSGNNRLSLGTKKLPVVTLRYIMGINDMLGSDFSYHKFILNLEQSIRMGAFGRSYYSLTGGYTNSRIPYPLLETHLGNNTVFYNFFGFNLMNLQEFISDKFVTLNFEHNFDGFIMNRIPLFKKLKWRSFVVGNGVYGEISPENIALHPVADNLIQVNSLGQDPYVEVGYGVSNIFKFFRVTFLHRLTYLDLPDVRNFGVFVSARFNL